MIMHTWNAIPERWKPRGCKSYYVKLPKTEDRAHPSSSGKFLKVLHDMEHIVQKEAKK